MKKDIKFDVWEDDFEESVPMTRSSEVVKLPSP